MAGRYEDDIARGTYCNCAACNNRRHNNRLSGRAWDNDG